jgi:hypothetical protein
VWKEWEDRKVMSLYDIGLGEEQIRMEEKERNEAEANTAGRSIPSAVFCPPRWKDGPPPPPRNVSLPSRRRKRSPPATDDEVPATSHKPFATKSVLFLYSSKSGSDVRIIILFTRSSPHPSLD